MKNFLKGFVTLSSGLLKLCLFIGFLTLPTAAICQEVTWTSSHPLIVSVDRDTGTIKMISEPATTTNVTIIQTTTQNGKTVTSTKIVQADACTACFTHSSRTYCGVRYAGECWLDRNIGASRVATSTCDTSACGTGFNYRTAMNACPSGWRLPNTSESVAVARAATGNNSITANSLRNVVTPAQMLASPLKATSGGFDDGYCGYFGGWYLKEGNGLYYNWWPSGVMGIPIVYAWTQYSHFHVRCVKN